MKIKVERNWLLGETTVGKIYVDGKFLGYTLEDRIRANKVKGETAIPYGLYEVDITYSPHFGKQMPLIKNVPNFEGIRMHTGQSYEDTEGCLLVGKGFNSKTKKLINSTGAFNELFAKLKKAKARGEKITIDITAPDKKKIIGGGLVALALIIIGGIVVYKSIKS